MPIHRDEGWAFPQRKPIIKDVLDRAIAAEEEAAHREYQAQEAWVDPQHGTVMLRLTDGRVFGAEPSFIALLQNASPKQLDSLRVSVDGVYLVLEELDLHITVDGLVRRIMEESPLAIKRSGARLAGLEALPGQHRVDGAGGRCGPVEDVERVPADIAGDDPGRAMEPTGPAPEIDYGPVVSCVIPPLAIGDGPHRTHGRKHGHAERARAPARARPYQLGR